MNIYLCINNYLEDVKARTSVGNYHHNMMNAHVLLMFFQKEKITSTEELKPQSIYDLITYLRDSRQNSLNSCNKKIGTLKRSLKYNNIYISGVSDFKKIRFPIKHFSVVPEFNLKKVLHYLYSLDNSPVNLTRKLVFLILLQTGVRAEEFIQIKIKNINLSLNMILLEDTKSKKPRYVFYDESINPLIEKYINLKDREYLFYNFRSKVDGRYTKVHLRSYFDYMKKKLSIKQLHPHMLRHTMATLLLDNNAPLTTIQMLLGHESLSTTQIYLHLSMKKIRNDYNKYFPKL